LDVEEFLERVNMSLVADGGEAELVDVSKTGEVKMRLKYSCCECDNANSCFQKTIAGMLKLKVPAVKSVIKVD